MERKLGDRVHKARIALKLTLRSAAAEMGFSAMYLSEIESGKKIPSVDILNKLANFYKVDFSELLQLANDSSTRSLDSDLRAKAARRLFEMPKEEFDQIAAKILENSSEK